MATTALPQVIDALVAQLQAASALSAVRVFDGIEVDGSYPGDAIVVGDDGGEDGDVTAGSGRQSYDTLGARSMYEDASLDCYLWAWDGSTDIRSRRIRAFQIFSAVDTAIRADPSLGSTCLYAGISDFSVAYRQTSNGAAVVINFSVTYRAKT